ncbi:E3 ubiquitin-protein ligase NEURL3 [Bombina bombina]|uniref:E3 ubiquitin-protein ligase NEURL3 n=1 Tax=Bombina bombina TaxID=8345 RepID=UPI00235AA9A8|nr:E3 ubiquitin-protein ligase NEURL3 [Bombina bombina]
MGSCISSQGKDLYFHPYAKGSYICLSDCKQRAERIQSFCNGILFSNRPIRNKERLCIRILEEDFEWHGGLRVGFTLYNPDILDPENFPRFACPDLTLHYGFWGVGIPDDLCQVGAVLSFWIGCKGQVFIQGKKDSCPRLLFSGLPKNTPLWCMLDVYGCTKTIKLLYPPKSSSVCSCCLDKASNALNARHSCPSSPTPCEYQDLQSESKYCCSLEDDPTCIICQDRLPDTLLLPCGHCTFCISCILEVQRQNAKCPLCRKKFSNIKMYKPDGFLTPG